MKNKVQAHRHGGTEAPSFQPKIRHRRVEHPGARPGGSIAVLLFDNAKDKTISPGIDLTGPEFAAIQRDAAARGETLAAWLVRTFNETPALRGERGEQPVPAEPRFGWLTELDFAKDQAHALQALLAGVLENQDGKLPGKTMGGVLELMAQTAARLERAANAVSSKLIKRATQENARTAAAKEVAA